MANVGKTMSALIAVTLCLSFFGVMKTVFASNGVNAVTNGGFEDGWIGWTPIGLAADVEVTSSPPPRSGTYCLGLQGEAAACQNFSSPVPMPNDRAIFFFAKCAVPGMTSTLVMEFVDQGGPGLYKHALTDSWQQFGFTFSYMYGGIKSIAFRTYDNSGNVYPESKLVDDVTFMIASPPTVESCDSTSSLKNTFNRGDTVHVVGSGYSRSNTGVVADDYDLYIVADTTWTDGMNIPGHIVKKTVSRGTVGGNDIIPSPTPVWGNTGPGEYDVLVDVNGDGKYTWFIDALDDLDAGTAGFFVGPQGTSTVFSEDFEGAFPAPNWNYPYDSNHANGDDYWDDTNVRSHGGGWSAWCADEGTQVVYITDTTWNATILDVPNTSVGQYDDNMEASLYRPVNLTGYSSATLSYWYWLDSEDAMDYLQVIYSTDAGWYYVDIHTGNSGGWQFSEANIPVNANYVGFDFFSDPSVHNYEGAYVDDVLLTAVPLPGTLMGTVIDAYTTNPIEGATVTAGGKSNLTDALGHYQIELAPGTYDVTAQKTGYYTSTVPGVTVPSDTVTTQNFNLQRLPPPTVESCDIKGARKDSFNGTETVYMNGSGYSPLASYNVYIVNDTAWVDGMNISPRVPATVLSMTLDASGEIKPVPVWFPPLTYGKYDVMVDVNNNGKYDFGIDALDDNDVQETSGFIVTAQEMWKLTIGLVGAGTIDPAPGVYTFTNGTEVPVTATSSPGWIFDHWVLDGIRTEWMNPVSITMGRDRDLTAVFVGNPPIVESCDRTGAQKDLFNSTETVCVNGTGYGQLAGADVYVVEDVTWTDGMTIPARVPGTIAVVNSDSYGNIVQTVLWNPPLTNGGYDVCVDINRNGRYDVGIDALDDNEMQATAGYQVVPEFSLFLILSFFMVATLLVVGVHKRIGRGGVV